MIRVLFFGPVAERVGQNNIAFPYANGLTLQHVHDQLQQRYADAFSIVCFTALNGEMMRDLSLPVADGDEVVFMSKFSGG